MLVITSSIGEIGMQNVSALFAEAGFHNIETSLIDSIISQDIKCEPSCYPWVTDSNSNFLISLKSPRDLRTMQNSIRENDLRYMLLYTSPYLLVASLLENQESQRIKSLLQEWYELAKYTLDFYKKNRSCCKIVQLGDCLEKPMDFIKLVNPAYELNNIEIVALESVSTSGVSLWIADQLLDVIVEVKSLHNEVDACCSLF